MGDMGDDFRAMKEMAKDRKAGNMMKNLTYLNQIGADYEVHNNGYQLNFNTSLGIIAFYPSTNKWVFDGKTHYGTAKDLANWVFNRLKFFDWVKRLGQWHLYKSGDIETKCGRPMLGNYYARHIPDKDRKPCKECFKGVAL